MNGLIDFCRQSCKLRERVRQPYRWITIIGFCTVERDFATVNLVQREVFTNGV
jgi:hypothetical protein